jgi:hypothetical protein
MVVDVVVSNSVLTILCGSLFATFGCNRSPLVKKYEKDHG